LARRPSLCILPAGATRSLPPLRCPVRSRGSQPVSQQLNIHPLLTLRAPDDTQGSSLPWPPSPAQRGWDMTLQGSSSGAQRSAIRRFWQRLLKLLTCQSVRRWRQRGTHSGAFSLLGTYSLLWTLLGNDLLLGFDPLLWGERIPCGPPSLHDPLPDPAWISDHCHIPNLACACKPAAHTAVGPDPCV
jgi:hypothetical protein